MCYGYARIIDPNERHPSLKYKCSLCDAWVAGGTKTGIEEYTVRWGSTCGCESKLFALEKKDIDETEAPNPCRRCGEKRDSYFDYATGRSKMSGICHSCFSGAVDSSIVVVNRSQGVAGMLRENKYKEYVEIASFTDEGRSTIEAKYQETVK